MCNTAITRGYSACVREDAIDMLMAGRSRGYVARTMNLSYPTVTKWLNEYRLAEAAIDRYLATH